MAETAQKIALAVDNATGSETKHLNIGCGFSKLARAFNVDGFANCEPDKVWNLNVTPYPWKDNEWDMITAFHVMEHLDHWWDAFRECARIVKPGGTIEIRVPHPSSDSAVTYRDHLHTIDLRSFDGVMDGPQRTTNAWFEQNKRVPVTLVSYHLVPFKQYNWMPSWMLSFCASHLRNFIWEQRIVFRKIGD